MDRDNPRPTAGAPDVGFVPAGEETASTARFDANQIADAFGVDVTRIHRALDGEFGLAPGDVVDSRQAQHLAEVVLGDQPLEQREAALMRLGAYTPRADEVEASVREEVPGEESDRLRPTPEAPDLNAPRESEP